METNEAQLTIKLVINYKIMPNLGYKINQDININEKIDEVEK
jgi:hypothetical protein